MTAWQQLDLFAEDKPADARVEWAARFVRAPWVTPYDTSSGMKAGDSVPGWVCPACSKVEPNSFVLNLSHGYDPGVPGRVPGWNVPFGESCSRMTLLASQERAAAAKRAREARAA